jgi:ParB-like chromosome segregation protein Spo0J
MMSSNAERPAKSDTPPNKEADPLPSATTEEKRSRRFELVPIDEIKPNSHYVRKPGRGQRSKLKASYRKFGENSPLLVDRNLVILAGVQRWEALKELGRSHVWVVVLDHLSDAQARGYALADNKIGEHSDWDPAKLGAELKELDAISVAFE